MIEISHLEDGKMNYRLGLDVGTTSIGWCLLRLDNGEPTSIADMGVRIFSSGRDDKTKEPLSVSRRNARSARRRRDRFKSRQQKLIELLTKCNLMPAERLARKQLEQADPYELRAKALDQKVTLHELGRALFHINQRRGFKSSRKDLNKDKESGQINSAIKEFKNMLAESGKRTLGEYLFCLKSDNKPTRVRPGQNNSKTIYDFYPERSMLQDEVKIIWEMQAKHYSELTQELYDEIEKIIFFQRDLREQEVGYCTFEPKARRARLTLPIAQKFRILQEVNNLDLVNYYSSEQRHLTAEQKQVIKDNLLNGQEKLTFNSIRKKLKLSVDSKFNLESEKRNYLNGDKTAKTLSDDDYFGDKWWSLSETQKTQIIKKILGDKDSRNNESEEILDDNGLIEWLQRNFDIDEQHAEKIAHANLPSGYSSLSEKAMQKIMPYLEAGDIYNVACEKAGYNHSDLAGDKVWNMLPYYGEVDILQKSIIPGKRKEEDGNFPEKYYGKINNPTVHIGLNQLRKLVNAIIEKYGRPQQIVIELARDLKNNVQEIDKEQAKNKKENERIAVELEKLGQKDNGENRMKYKLWEDLASNEFERCCPFTGKKISLSKLFSDEIVIEHLLPFSETFDDSRANKVVCYRRANHDKGGHSPYDAFGYSPNGYDWQEIVTRSQNLPKNKQWRFAPNAMEKFTRENGPIARQLKDTQHFAKVARQYLSTLYARSEKSNVWSVKGQMTAMLRREWGLNKILQNDDNNKKNRWDHRHHAIDAFVVACISISTLQKVQCASKNSYLRSRLFQNLALPFSEFNHESFKENIDNVIVSYKPDHGNAQQAVRNGKTVAKLHDETAYGYVEQNSDGTLTLVKRVNLLDVTRRKNEQKRGRPSDYVIENIRDQSIKDKLLKNLDGIAENSGEWKQALEKFSENNNIKTIRLLFKNRDGNTFVGIGGNDIQPYKYLACGENYCIEIFCPKKDKRSNEWQSEVISNFTVHQKGFVQKWRRRYPTAKLIMRLHKDDMMVHKKNGHEKICRVIGFSGGKVTLLEHNIADKNNKAKWTASASELRKAAASRIFIDILGCINQRNNKGKKQK